MDDLDRLFNRLVHSIRSEHPEYLTRPFEIVELYQKLVPYRHYRRELRIDTNQDYEAAVTRLLSGERGYLVGDEGMQEFLRTELASPNPDTAVFREFGSNHVAIAPGALERMAVDSARPPARNETGATTPARATPELDTRGDRTAVSAKAIEAVLEKAPPEVGVAEEVAVTPAVVQPLGQQQPPVPDPQIQTSPQPVEEMASRSVSASDLGGKCRYCSGLLPEGRRIVFCPHCGQNLTVHRCPACSTELEMGWKFCVTCGRTVATAASPGAG